MKRVISIIAIVIVLMGMVSCQGKSGELDVISNFGNSIFLGDSITEGFVFNEILPEENVIAGAGATVGFIMEDIDIMFEKKPDSVFIMLGSVDLFMPVDDPKDLFRTDLTRLVNEIKQKLPKCSVYLQSITPVTEEAIIEEPRYEEIEKYNEIIKEVAENESVHYIDMDSVVKVNADLYAEDGVHFKKEFYDIWLNELVKSI